MVNAYDNKECEIKINGFLPSELNQKFLSNAVCYFSLMKVIDITDMEINKIMENEQLINEMKQEVNKKIIPLISKNNFLIINEQ